MLLQVKQLRNGIHSSIRKMTATKTLTGQLLLFPEVKEKVMRELPEPKMFLGCEELAAIAYTDERGKPVSVDALPEELRALAAECISLSDAMPVDAAICGVRDLYVSTMAAEAARETVLKKDATLGDVTELSATLEELLTNTATDDASLSEQVEDWLRVMKERADGKVDAIPSSIPIITDKLGGGYRFGQFYLIKAREGVGKSAFAIQEALHAALCGKRVVIYSVEMTSTQIVERMITLLSGIENYLLRSPKRLSDGERLRLKEAVKIIKALPLIIRDNKYSDAAIIADLRMQVRGSGVDFVVIDYFQRVEFLNGEANDERRIAMFSKLMTNMAKEYGYVLLGTSQVNQERESRGSRVLQHDAFCAMLIDRPDYTGLTNATTDKLDLWKTNIIISKNRGGAPGFIFGEVGFAGALAQFYEIGNPDTLAQDNGPVFASFRERYVTKQVENEPSKEEVAPF